jgi:hypothetical protein
MINIKKLFYGGLLFVIATTCAPRAFAADDQKAAPSVAVTDLYYTNQVQARAENWTCSGLDVLEGDSATLTVSGEWTVTPGRKSDAGGNGTPADGGGQPALTGVNEGALIVGRKHHGNFVETIYFTSNSDKKYIQKPGEICFLANDYHHPKNGAGYKDNSGSLTVLLHIRTTHPEHYPAP